MIRRQPSRAVCKRSAEVLIKDPKSATGLKVIVNRDKENSPTQIHSMPNQRVLRKRKARQVSLKEESSDDSEAEMMDVGHGKNPMDKSQKGPGKSKKSAKQIKESDTDSDFIVSEDLSKTLKYKTPLQKTHGRAKKRTENSDLASIKEDPSTSESDDDMVNVFTEKKFNADQSGLMDNNSNSELASVHESIADKNHSESSNRLDVMEMLMACESAKDKPGATANESDSDDNWEQVMTKQSSPLKKSAKSKQRKQKHTENCDTAFELNPSNEVKDQLKGKSQKRKKSRTDSGEEKSKPKKPKKEQLSEAEKEIIRFTNRCLKDRDSCLEQCSLVMGVAFICNIMRCSRKPLFQSLLLSLLPEKLHVGKKGLDHFISTLLNWYIESFHLQIVDTKPVDESCSFLLMELISSGKTQYEHIYVAGFCTLLQVLGLEARFVGSLYVPSLEKVAKNVKLSVKAKVNPTFWVESKDNNKILAIDVVNGNVVTDAFNEYNYIKPPAYIVSITDDLVVLDSTPKYSEKWSEIHRKARMLNFGFWDNFIGDQPKHSLVLIREHNRIMKHIMIGRGFPKSLGGFKHNLVFALEKDNLKTEAIHPKDAPVLGTFRSHNVYSRDNVKSLKQVIVIKKEGRALKDGEVPYKIVKQKIVFDRWPGDDRWKDLPLYGDWQTEWYKAPTAENGVIPRNDFGNVELFKPWMLPKGTEHVNLSGSYGLARRLNIDAAHAVTGFDFPRCRAVPVMSGVVVCTENAEMLRIAWIEYNAIQTQRAEDKRVKRIYDNWKLLIKSLLIKMKIANKYEGMRDSSSVAPKGHIHKFPAKSRRKDKVTGEMVQKCFCGLVVPVGSFEEEL